MFEPEEALMLNEAASVPVRVKVRVSLVSVSVAVAVPTAVVFSAALKVDDEVMIGALPTSSISVTLIVITWMVVLLPSLTFSVT